MDQLEETELKEVKPKTKTRKHPRKKKSQKINENPDTEKQETPTSANFGLAAELGSLKEDIITIAPPKSTQANHDRLITEANKIPLTVKNDELPVGYQPKANENIYIEKHLGFRTEPMMRYERRLDEKQKALQKAALKRTRLEETNPGLMFALGMHGIIDRMGRTTLGLFAGASLVHTLFVQSFRVPKYVQSNGLIQYEKDNGLQLVLRYGLYTEAVSIAYYIAFILTGLFVFERFDVGRPTNKCMIQCVSLANGGFSVLFHVCAFVISNAMQWFNYSIHTVAIAPKEEISGLLTSQPEYTRWLDVWLILDICRTAFLVASWLFIGFSSSNFDRTRETLYVDPIVEDEQDVRVGPNSEGEDLWRSTETVKTLP